MALHYREQPARKHSNCLTKAKRFAYPGIWPRIVGKQPESKILSAWAKARLFAWPVPAYCPMQWGNYLQWNILSTSVKAELFARPGISPCNVGKQPVMKQSICLCYNLGRFEPTLFGVLSLLCAVQISWGSCKGKLHAVFTGAIQCVAPPSITASYTTRPITPPISFQTKIQTNHKRQWGGRTVVCSVSQC